MHLLDNLEPLTHYTEWVFVAGGLKITKFAPWHSPNQKFCEVPETLNCTYDFGREAPETLNFTYDFGREAPETLDFAYDFGHKVRTYLIVQPDFFMKAHKTMR